MARSFLLGSFRSGVRNKLVAREVRSVHVILLNGQIADKVSGYTRCCAALRYAVATDPAEITVGMDRTRAYPSWFLPISATLRLGNTVDRVSTVLPGWLAAAAVTACVPELPHARLTLLRVSSLKLQVIVRSAVETATPTGVGCSSITIGTVVGANVSVTPSRVPPT